MHNLWLAFKCLSLIAGCLFMIAMIVAMVESIRSTFKKKTYQNKIDDYIEKVLEESFNEAEKEEK